MQIDRFLRATRFTSDRHNNRLFHPYLLAAEKIVGRYRQVNGLNDNAIIFFPAYTSRASPELILLNQTQYVIGDCHFVELVYNLNLLTISQSMADENDPLSNSVFTEESVTQFFRALLFRYLSFQFFLKSPYLSVGLSEAYAELSCRHSNAVRPSDKVHLDELNYFQWSYVLNHELAHVSYKKLSFSEKQGEIDWILNNLAAQRSFYKSTFTLIDEAAANSWWGAGHNLYVTNLLRHSEGMANSVDERITEELICDIIAHRLNVLNWCIDNEVEYDINDNRCVTALNRSLSAATIINNYRYLLSVLSNFWHEVSACLESDSLTESYVEQIWVDIQNNAQEVFLRGDMGTSTAMYASLASLMKESAISLDDPRVVHYLLMNRSNRKTKGTLENFDDRLTKAWAKMAQTSGACVDSNVVMEIVRRSRNAKEISKIGAIERAIYNTGWDL